MTAGLAQIRMTKTLLFALLGLSMPVMGQELNIYLWEDTLSPRVIDVWNQTHDTPLHLYHFDNDDERSLLMLNSVQLPFDVVILDNVSAHIFSRQNEFEDLSELSGRDNNFPRWNQACGTHAIPYFWGYVGIAYRKSKVAAPPTHWSQLVNISDELKGHVGLIYDSVETLLPALYSLAYSPITDSLPELKEAYQVMEAATPKVLTYEYALSYVRSHTQNDDLFMALAYSGDHYALNRFFNNDDWAFTLPQGKPYIWIDCLAINSNSQQKAEARAFLEFLMRPDIAAMNAQDMQSATPNRAAMALLPQQDVHDSSLYLSDAQLDQAIIDHELSPRNLSVRAKIINNVIDLHEAKP